MNVVEDPVVPSELENLLAVFGAVDIAVQDDPEETGEARLKVASLLPYYESPRVHWYRDFVEWAEERGAPPPPPVEDAVVNLADDTERRSPRLDARRLLALYVAAQGVPSLFAPEGRYADEVRAALVPLVRDDIGARDDAARRLHGFMARDHPPVDVETPDQRWHAFIEVAEPDIDVTGLEPRPCTGRLIRRAPGRDPVTILRTEFEVEDLPFDKAIRFLSPENWPGCCDFWCNMDRIEAGVPDWIHRYNEKVSTNCVHPDQATFTARAVLDFKFGLADDVATADYDLAPGFPGDLLVDSGSLVVHRLSRNPEKLRITTTKRLKLSGPLSGEALAMVACALGWLESSKDLVYNCALREPDDAGRDFPATPGVPAARRIGSREDAATAAIVKQTAAAVKECVDDQVKWTEQWADRLTAEGYGFREWADDVARLSARMVYDGARMVNLAMKNAQVGAMGSATRSADSVAGEDSDEDHDAGEHDAPAGKDD